MTTAAATLRRADQATPLGDLPGRWTPRPRAAAVLSTSDVQVPVIGRAHSDVLLARLYEIPLGDAGRVAVRAGVIEWYLPMSVHLARRFGGRGEPFADLAQVAAIGLIKAVDRYDPARGVPFANYAIPTIVGEIKRHFRDTGWTVRVPRRLQELGPHLALAVEELAQVLHRSPTTVELAARLGVSHEEILEARRCAGAYRPRSFDQPGPDSEVPALIDRLGGPDVGIEAVEQRATLRLGLAALSVRQRRVIALRFVDDLTQQQIATRIGMSQMHVSRLLVRSLAQLRDGMRGDVDSGPHRAGQDATYQIVDSGPASRC